MTDGSNHEGKAPGSTRAGLRQRLADAREREQRAAERAQRAAPRSGGLERWGLTPGMMLGLIIVAGVVIGAGLILALTAPDPAEAPAVAETAVPVKPTLMPAARPPAEEAIDDYVILVRQGMYDVAWERTTERFQADNYPGGFAAFEQTWASNAELEVVSKRVIVDGDDEVTVAAEIRNLDTGATYTNAYQLVFDGASGLWLIDSVTQVW